MEVTGVVTIGTKERSMRDMKKIVFAISIFAAIVMTACTPETRNQMLGIPDDAILLSTENFIGNDTKTAVSGTSVVWVGEGESIDFYVGTVDKQTKEVVVDGDNAYIASPLEGPGVIRGYYPSGICGGSPTSNTPSIKYPSEYTCSVDGDGRQVIALPMVGKASADAESIRFRHVTAAINVQLMDSLGEDIYVDKVEVISDAYALNSKYGAAVNINEDVPVCSGSPYESGSASDRIVTVTFPTPFEVPAGSNNKSIQVPIRPIGSDYLTIKVYCHSASKTYLYSYKPNVAVPALGRNEMLSAKVKLKLAANGGHVEQVVYRKINLANESSPFSAQNGDTLFGIPSSNFIVNISADATITLNGVNAAGKSLSIRALGNATINLLGTNNTITGNANYVGIHGKSGYTITIQGTGSLFDSVNVYGTAAIGSCYGYTGCNYIIKGGNITAIATNSAAAIGCAGSYSCGNITINGGTVIAKTTVNNAAAIGTSQNNSSTCGTITIENTVESVKATKGSGAVSCIGTGVKKASTQTCGAVTIGDEPQTVNIDGYDYNGVDANGANNTYTYTPAN